MPSSDLLSVIAIKLHNETHPNFLNMKKNALNEWNVDISKNVKYE